MLIDNQHFLINCMWTHKNYHYTHKVRLIANKGFEVNIKNRTDSSRKTQISYQYSLNVIVHINTLLIITIRFCLVKSNKSSTHNFSA